MNSKIIISFSVFQKKKTTATLDSLPRSAASATAVFTFFFFFFFFFFLSSIINIKYFNLVFVVATTRRLASDSGAFADWVGSSSTDKTTHHLHHHHHDLSLGFNATASSVVPTTTAISTAMGVGPTSATYPMWPPQSSHRPTLGYTLPSEMGMFVVAPATSFHQHDSLVSDPILNPTSSSSATATALGVGVGVIPLLTATPCAVGGGSGGFESVDIMNRNRTASAIHLWQQNQHHHHQQQQQQQQQVGSCPNKKSISFEQSAANLLPSSSSGGGGGGTATCQDCGNQAKKDCSHRRCRTCCRSRGFDCSTHVKSTWVPASRRRERQMIGAPVSGGGGGASSGSTSGVKKPRLISSQNTATTSHTSTSNTPPRSFDSNSTHQDASFKESLPGQVKAPAVFKCVRVTAVDDGEDEFAYQAVVKIGGHVFKGFLYDQGIEPRDGFPNLSELHLGGGGGGGGGRSNGGSGSSPLLDPADVFGTGGAGGLLGGSTYGSKLLLIPQEAM